MIEYIIEQPQELEVNKKRIPLSYHVSTPNTMDENTIPVVVLHGYGEYSNSNYMNSLHASMTSKHNIVIISLNYVGTFSKFSGPEVMTKYPFVNQTLNIQEGDNKKVFLQLLEAMYKKPDEMVVYLKEKDLLSPDIDLKPHLRAIELLIFKIENLLCDGTYVLERLFEFGFKSSFAYFIATTEGDHQDFGLIQAIDVLTVIADIKRNDTYKNINWSKLSIVGTSHGGYIASMCDKIAPNTFANIVNNAGWLYPKENFFLGQITSSFLTLKVNMLNDDYWSNEPNSVNYFSNNKKQIRDLSNSKHIKEQLSQTLKTHKKYCFSHTINDNLIPIEEKDNYISTLQQIQYNIDYVRLDSESKLDGQTFKNLSHGANASLKGLIIEYVVNNEIVNIDKNDFDLKSIIEYSCDDGKYIIDFTNKYPSVSFKPY